MKEDDTRKARDTPKTAETPKSSDKKAALEERNRNSDFWSRGNSNERQKDAISEPDKSRDQERGGLKTRNSKSTAEVPASEALGKRLEAAWNRREEPGRFSTEGKTAVFYSGTSKLSEDRLRSLGDRGDREGTELHSGELAALHAHDNPETHIKIEETRGGRELQSIHNDIHESKDLSGPEKEDLKAAMQKLWDDASNRFSISARENAASVSYTENAQRDKAFRQIERHNLRQEPEHVSLSDAPLRHGKPPEQDQVPERPFLRDGKTYTGIDKEGKYYRS